MPYGSLEKDLCTASMTKLHTSISSSDLGIEIKVKCFRDKTPALLREVVSAIAHPKSFVSEASFCLQSEELIRMHRNNGLKSSSTVTGALLVALKSTECSYCFRFQHNYFWL